LQRQTCGRWISPIKCQRCLACPRRSDRKETKTLSTRRKTAAPTLPGCLLGLYHLEDLSRRISGFGRVLFVSEQCVLAPSGSMGIATITPAPSGGQIPKLHRQDDPPAS